MSDELYGIDIDHAHPRAVELIPEEFFWNCVNELSPYGSDEGDTALAEFRDWRKENPAAPTLECLVWTIESVGEMDIADYNSSLLDPKTIQQQMEDPEFDDQQYIFTLDVSVIATGFAQLVDEGTIDPANKPLIQLAIDRQIAWCNLQQGWGSREEYLSNLAVLNRVLAAA